MRQTSRSMNEKVPHKKVEIVGGNRSSASTSPSPYQWKFSGNRNPGPGPEENRGSSTPKNKAGLRGSR